MATLTERLLAQGQRCRGCLLGTLRTSSSSTFARSGSHAAAPPLPRFVHGTPMNLSLSPRTAAPASCKGRGSAAGSHLESPTQQS